MTDQASFILFITDQHRADHLGCYGHPVLKTPNIDAIASRGVCFDRFFVTSPVCMPNRASLMTCRMPSSHGVRSNGIPLSRRNVTFVELLRDAGYDTALIGKSHLQNFSGQPPFGKPVETRDGFHRAGGELSEAARTDTDDPFYSVERPQFWEDPNPDFPTPFYGFDHVEVVTRHGDAVGGSYLSWLKERNPDAANLQGPDNQLDHDYICPQAVRTALPEELYSTTYIAERACAWLDSRAETDRPFFLMVSWPDPHHPFNPPGKYWDMYKPEDMDLPAAFANNDWTPPAHVATAIAERDSGEANMQGMNSVACTSREALEARALTCGMISMIDDAVGDVMASLSNATQGDDTVVCFTADHGDHLGDHQLLFKGSEQYDQIIRVPFIWCDPEGPAGQREDGLAQTHDIGTTILERARIEAASGMQGQPLPVVDGAPRKAALIQYEHQKPSAIFGPHPRVHTVQDGRWRLSVYDASEFGELYDLGTDPDELTNLWDDPVAAEDKSRLLLKLAKLEVAVMDRIPVPSGRA